RLLIRLSEEPATTTEEKAPEGPKKSAGKQPSASIDRPVPARAPDVRTEGAPPAPRRRDRPDLRIEINSPSTPPPPPPVPVTITPSAARAPAAVPWCVLTGSRLTNFALHDLDGQAWEYQRDRKGRLILLDFWYSSCGPCLRAIE